MERHAWLLTVKFDSCNNLYHPFILTVSFCVLSSLIIKNTKILLLLLTDIASLEVSDQVLRCFVFTVQISKTSEDIRSVVQERPVRVMHDAQMHYGQE